MIDEIVLYIIAIAPSLTAVITGISMVVTFCKNFEKLKQDIQAREDIEAIKNKFKKILQENYELKQLIKELLEKIDGIKRTNEEDQEQV